MYNNFNDSTTLIITLRRFDSLSILRSNFLRSLSATREYLSYARSIFLVSTPSVLGFSSIIICPREKSGIIGIANVTKKKASKKLRS